MSIYKRKETWWIQFTDSNGNRIQQTAGTKDKQQAQELHDRLKAESWRIKNVGSKPRYVWQDAVVRWMTENSDKKSLREDKNHLRWLDKTLSGKYIDEINKSCIDAIKQEKIVSGVANATVNRMLSVISVILNKAYDEWGWIDTVPPIKLMPVKNQRIRWLTHDETERLLKECPPHIKAMVEFTLATGLREANVVGLKWDQLDMQRRCAWVHADESKNKQAIAVPLNSEALSIIRDQIGKSIYHVFTYEGKPVTRANNHAWRNSLNRAGITDFRWHDLRHTWASRHIQNGTPIQVLKELGGWSDLKMVLRYAHLSAAHLSEYAENPSNNSNNSDAILRHDKK